MENLEHWEIDADHSSFGFSLRHLVVSEIKGRFGRWGGSLLLNRSAPAQSRVRVWVDLTSIETGAVERDNHVKSAEFLDVARFPAAEFRSTSITVRDHDPVSLVGRLALHGTVRGVRLDVVAGEAWTDGEGRARASYVARGKIDRQAFGLHWNQDLDVGGVVVGDEVELRVELELLGVRAGANAQSVHEVGAGPARFAES